MASSSTLPTPTTFVPNNGQPATRHTPLLSVFQNLINDPLFHKALYLKPPPDAPRRKANPTPATVSTASTSKVHLPIENGKFANWKLALKTKLIAWDNKFNTPWPEHGDEPVPSNGDELTVNELLVYFVLDKNGTFNFTNYDKAENNWKVAAEQVVAKVQLIGHDEASLADNLTEREFVIYCLSEFGLYTIWNSVVDRRSQTIELLTKEVLRLPVLRLESKHTADDKAELLRTENLIRDAKLLALATPVETPSNNKLAEAIQAFLKKKGNELADGQFQNLNERLSGRKVSSAGLAGLKKGLNAKKKGIVSRAKLLQDSGDLFKRNKAGEDFAVDRALALINEAVGSMDAAIPTGSASTRSGVAGNGENTSDDANSRVDKGKGPDKSLAIVLEGPVDEDDDDDDDHSSAVSETEEEGSGDEEEDDDEEEDHEDEERIARDAAKLAEEEVSDAVINNDAAADDLLALPAPLEAMDLKELQYMMKARGFKFGKYTKAVLVERLAKIWNQVPDLNELTVVELKYLLSMRKLEMTGNKAELMERLGNNGYGT
jgi:hypothetical protein